VRPGLSRIGELSSGWPDGEPQLSREDHSSSRGKREAAPCEVEVDISEMTEQRSLRRVVGQLNAEELRQAVRLLQLKGYEGEGPQLLESYGVPHSRRRMSFERRIGVSSSPHFQRCHRRVSLNGAVRMSE